jgi:hypothetical protein
MCVLISTPPHTRTHAHTHIHACTHACTYIHAHARTHAHSLPFRYGSLGSDGQLELREPSPQALHRGSVRHVLSTYEAMLEAVNRMRRRKREMSVEGQLVEAKGAWCRCAWGVTR